MLFLQLFRLLQNLHFDFFEKNFEKITHTQKSTTKNTITKSINFTDSLLNEGITYETAGSLKNGRTIWLLAKMPERKILDDKLFEEMEE